MQHDRQESRFDVGKVHDRKKTIFGPNVIFDGERCIKCTRCVRFCQEITKTDELTVINRGDHSTIALFDNAVLDNPLSANVVDICPVGALTDRDFRFKVASGICKKPRRSARAAVPAATSASRPIRIASRALSRGSMKRSTAIGFATRGAIAFTIWPVANV